MFIFFKASHLCYTSYKQKLYKLQYKVELGFINILIKRYKVVYRVKYHFYSVKRGAALPLLRG